MSVCLSVCLSGAVLFEKFFLDHLLYAHEREQLAGRLAAVAAEERCFSDVARPVCLLRLLALLAASMDPTAAATGTAASAASDTTNRSSSSSSSSSSSDAGQGGRAKRQHAAMTATVTSHTAQDDAGVSAEGAAAFEYMVDLANDLLTAFTIPTSKSAFTYLY